METEIVTTIDKIKSNYQNIKGKTNFIIEISKDVGRAKGTIRNHWFGGFWEIPSDYQAQVLKLIINKINAQKKEQIKT